MKDLSSIFTTLEHVDNSVVLRWNEGLLNAGCGMVPFTVGGTFTILSDSLPIRLPAFVSVRAAT